MLLAAAVAALAVTGTFFVVEPHLMGWSEPLFIFWSLLVLLALERAGRTPGWSSVLISGAVQVGRG